MKLNMLLEELQRLDKDIENLSKLANYISANEDMNEELDRRAGCDGSVEIMLRRASGITKEKRNVILNTDVPIA